jgi:hypothetical protein
MNPLSLPVPHRRQRDTGDCLAACAAMILAYLENPIAYDQLLKLLQIEWFGTPYNK